MSGSWMRIVVAFGVAAVVFGRFLAVEYVLRRVLRRRGQRAYLLGELAEYIHRPVTDATNTLVRARALVNAADAPT